VKYFSAILPPETHSEMSLFMFQHFVLRGYSLINRFAVTSRRIQVGPETYQSDDGIT
jgi:hypothetical protein